MDKHITTPITEEVTKDLKSGDYVYITGTIYVARDAAHKRMIEALQRGEELPIDIKDSAIYYMGPSPAREGRPIGSAGPTTATRMDKYAPTLLDLGEKAMIGKGKRSKEVIDAIVRNHAVYFAAVGGAGALLSKCITKSEVIAYDDVVDHWFDEIKKELIARIAQDSSAGEEFLDVFMVAKYLERIGDHATNLAEWVEYAMTGARSKDGLWVDPAEGVSGHSN